MSCARAAAAGVVLVLAGALGCTGDASGGAERGPSGEMPARAHAGSPAISDGLGSGGTTPVVSSQPEPMEPPMGGAPPGTFVPPSQLDPDASFDWPEAQQSGGCKPGTYTGTFMCTLMPDPDGGVPAADPNDPYEVSGPITLTFAPSMDGEFLDLADGSLEGAAQDIFGFTAKLSGRIDCTTLQFAAEATDGTYGLGLPILVPLGSVTGTLMGTLDPGTLMISGEWALAPGDSGFGACIGPWTATLTPAM